MYLAISTDATKRRGHHTKLPTTEESSKIVNLMDMAKWDGRMEELGLANGSLTKCNPKLVRNSTTKNHIINWEGKYGKIGDFQRKEKLVDENLDSIDKQESGDSITIPEDDTDSSTAQE